MTLGLCVSVIMPVYNSENYLREAIESVISHHGVEVELIVVDDGSIDASRDIAHSYPSVRVLEQAHLGACKARNHGLRNATGEFVKFLDSDDFLEPGCLRKQVDLLRKVDENTIVYSDVRYFNDENGTSRVQSVNLFGDDDQVIQLLKSNIQTPAPLHRRISLLEVGGFDERLLKAQEYNLHLRLALTGYTFQRLPGVGTHVREHTAPHRISNQLRSLEVEKNAELRSRIYLELFQDRYGALVPPAIRRHFASGGAETALTRIRRGDFSGAHRALRYAMQFDPTPGDLLSGFGEAARRILHFKLRGLRARLTKK